MLLWVYCLMCFPLFVRVCACLCLVCITLCPFYFCNIFEEEERSGCFALLSYRCIVSVNVLWLFLMVPWVGLQCDCGIF